jgi:hypothetical protein
LTNAANRTNGYLILARMVSEFSGILCVGEVYLNIKPEEVVTDGFRLHPTILPQVWCTVVHQLLGPLRLRRFLD